MAGASLLALLDDITSILDDVAVLTKVATKKTAGVLGDDLALNAQQVAGVTAERELPVVWAVACGSLVNKAVLVPLALGISALVPWAITPLLMIGGTYLCFEGFEKVLHALTHCRHASSGTSHDGASSEGDRPKPAKARLESAQSEREKIKGAIRTDFVLSAEIVTIALGSVATASFMTRVLALSAIGIVMTVGVYGVVALIVKLDDFGLYLCTVGAGGRFRRTLGMAILKLAPWLMKSLSVVGTLAMFLVGGGIVVHGVPWSHQLDRLLVAPLDHFGQLGQSLGTTLSALVVGFGLGLMVWAFVEGATWALGRKRRPTRDT